MEVVSVLVVTPDEATARLVGPALAKATYPRMRLGKAVHVEWVGLQEGYTLPGFEVLVEVDPILTPLSGAIRAEDRPRA